jgi:hypothetical protein
MNRIQVIPDKFDPRRQIVSAFEFSPDFTLPAGKIYQAPRGSNTVEQLLNKGVSAISKYHITHLSNAEQYDLMTRGLTYDDVPKSSEVLRLPDSGLDEWTSWNGITYNRKYLPNGPLTYEQGKEKGSISDVGHHVQVYETEENYDYIDRNLELWRGYYENHIPRMKNRFEARGIKSYTGHSYLNLGWPAAYTLGNATREEHKAMLTKNISQMPFTQYSPNGTLGLCDLIVDAVYLGVPDSNRKNILGHIFRLMVFKQMGKASGTFMSGSKEWRPNLYLKTNYEDGGRLYLQTGIANAAYEFISHSFAGFTHGDGFFGWGYTGKTNNKRFSPDFGNSGSEKMYFPAGSNSQGANPHNKRTGDDAYYGYNGATDFVHMGAMAYAKTFGQTLGENKYWPDIKINNGSYRSGHVVDAYFDNMPMMYTERKGNKIAWEIVDPINDNRRKLLTWKDQGGNERSIEIAGSGTHCGIETV